LTARSVACRANDRAWVGESLGDALGNTRIGEDAVTEQRAQVLPELREGHLLGQLGPVRGSQRETREHLQRKVRHRPPRSIQALEVFERAGERREQRAVDVLADEVAVEGLANGIRFDLVVPTRGRANHLDDVRHRRASADGLAKDGFRAAAREPLPKRTPRRGAERLSAQRSGANGIAEGQERGSVVDDAREDALHHRHVAGCERCDEQGRERAAPSLRAGDDRGLGDELGRERGGESRELGELGDVLANACLIGASEDTGHGIRRECASFFPIHTWSSFLCVPDGIRTRVSGLRAQSPWPSRRREHW
jgi:hypothetical protein